MRTGIRNKIILVLIMLIGMTIQVEAIDIDPTQQSSMKLHYQYDEEIIEGMSAKIYKIANVDAQGVYQYTGNFVDRTESINGISASQTNSLARKLAKVVEEEKIEADYEKATEKSGDIILEAITPGVYLVTSEKKAIEEKEYTVSAFLVAIPQMDGAGAEYVYDLEVDVKVEMTLIPTPSPSTTPTATPTSTNNNTVNSPSTYDPIILYVGVLGVCIIGLVVAIVYYINKNKKKEVEENEKKS